MTWTYSWADAHGAPAATIETRATDDSGNIETPTDAITRQHQLPVLDLGTRLHPGPAGRGRRQPDHGGREVHVRHLRRHQRDQVLQVGQEHGDGGQPACRAAVDQRPAQPLATANFNPGDRDGFGVADGELLARPCRSTRTPPTSRPTSRPNGHNAEDDGVARAQPAASGTPSTADAPPLHAVRSTATSPNGVSSRRRHAVRPSRPQGTLIRQPGGDNFGVDVSFTPEPAPGPATARGRPAPGTPRRR